MFVVVVIVFPCCFRKWIININFRCLNNNVRWNVSKQTMPLRWANIWGREMAKKKVANWTMCFFFHFFSVQSFMNDFGFVLFNIAHFSSEKAGFFIHTIKPSIGHKKNPVTGWILSTPFTCHFYRFFTLHFYATANMWKEPFPTLFNRSTFIRSTSLKNQLIRHSTIFSLYGMLQKYLL